ncbi:VOC family protein [Sinirhodobacter sp. WL0062]|uniref:VOC family protein n=1 Tax=Rhodobacter flavimaris TaxID=2907145 RepID=A0ABS8YUL1_9RHOB|nr:VOC family protein [Sinirhodobacter sp. WL0062]MCE5972765.1 VOC family protein [Sinirhodobacter sp. WL0062]
MFSHVTLGIADLTRARAFYTPLMELLGLRLRFDSDEEGWIGWQPNEGGRPLFIVTRPFDGRAPAHSNGAMVAFMAADRAAVDAAHRHALAHGSTDEGAPGLRPHYHPDYYAAYFRDPDGNKLCVVCHAPV